MAISSILDSLTPFRPIIPLALSASLAGCVLSTSDIHRPLAIDHIPEKTTALATLAGSETTKRDIQQSMDLTRDDVEFFAAKSYGHGVNLLAIQNIGEALSHFPQNAYAWIQLGADLALMNQMDIAAASNKKGLELIASAGGEKTQELAPLETVALLNLASFNLSMEDYESAFNVLQKLNTPPSDPIYRLAYYWTTAQALSALGETDEARETLRLAREIRPFESTDAGNKQRLNYPQYSERTMWYGNFLYIEGLIALDERDYQTAIAKLSESEKQDARLWESSFALANALFADGRTQEAAAKLEILEKTLSDKPTMFFRRERIAFNLGNAYMKLGNLQSAIGAYRRAITLSEDRAKEFRSYAIFYLDQYDKKRLLRNLLQPSLQENAGIFSEAYTNLGNAYSSAWADKRSGTLFDQARKSYVKALENNHYKSPFRAWTNLGLLYWRAGFHKEALGQMERALSAEPSYTQALDSLLAMAGITEEPGIPATQDRKLDAEACFIWIDAIGQLGPTKLLLEQFGKPLDLVQQRLEQDPNEEEALRALSSLLIVKGTWDSAEELYRKSEEKFPKASWPLIGLAKVELKKENPNRITIEYWLTTAINIKTNSRLLAGTAVGSLAGAFLAHGIFSPYPDDHKYLSDETSHIAELRDAHYLLGRLKLETQEWTKARSEFETVLKIVPNWGPATAAIAYIDKQQKGLP